MRRELILVAALTAIAQAVAFIKLLITARLFGVGALIDGYNLAVVLPILVSGSLAGILQTGLFPRRARIARDEPERLEAFEWTVLAASAALGVALSITFLVSEPIVLRLSAPDASAAVVEATRFVLPFAAFMIAGNMIIDSAGYVLAMRGRFWVAAAAPIANGAFAAGLLAAWPEGGLLNLALGTVLGMAIQAVICVMGLRGSLSGPRLLPVREAADEIGRIVRLGSWIAPGVVFANLTIALPPLWLAGFGEGAVSSFGYASRLHAAALQLLVVAGSSVILAHLSDIVARCDERALRRVFVEFGAFALGAGVLGWLAVWLVGPFFLHVLFDGRQSVDALELVHRNWLWLMGGLSFAIFGNVFAKRWQAEGKPGIMTLGAAINLVAVFAVLTALEAVTPLSAAIATTTGTGAMLAFAFVRSAWRRRARQPDRNARR